MRQLLPLQYVETIARLGSIRKAAEVLAITPSALNRRLLSIEDEIGVALFERLPSGVQLSTAGEILLEHVRHQISDMERVKSRIADLTGMRRGHVKVATSNELIGDFLSQQITHYRREFPSVTFQVEHMPRGAAEIALTQHSSDIALIFEPVKLANFQVVASTKQPIMCTVAKDHPLAKNDTVRLYECCEFPMQLPDSSHGIRHLLDAAAVRLGLELRPVVQSNSLEFLKRCSLGAEYVSFDIPINLAGGTNDGEILVKQIDTRDVPAGFLFAGHLRSRALPVAAARFLEQVVHSLAQFE